MEIPVDKPDHDDLAAWRHTLRARTAARLGGADTPEAILDKWRAQQVDSPTARPVVARIQAAVACRDRCFGVHASLANLRMYSLQGAIFNLVIALDSAARTGVTAGRPEAAAAVEAGIHLA